MPPNNFTFGEPWIVVSLAPGRSVTVNGCLHYTKATAEWRLLDRQRFHLASTFSSRYQAALERAAACVNACAGLEDPGAEIAETRILLEAARAENQRLRAAVESVILACQHGTGNPMPDLRAALEERSQP